MRIDTVLASNAEQTVRLGSRSSLRQPFHGLFPYSSYRLIQGEQRRVGWRREARVPAPRRSLSGGDPARLQERPRLAQRHADPRHRPLVNTVLSLKNHGTFLVAGPHYQEGVLIIAIGAGTPTATAVHAAAATSEP